jgi:nicotinate-nucleotide pyrophosphorylase (carboxylating)
MTIEAPAAPSLSPDIIACIRRALDEDLTAADVTTNAIFPPDSTAKARITAKQHGIVAGLDVAKTAFLLLDGQMKFDSSFVEGANVQVDDVLLMIAGSARALLTGERTALNFLGRMSGIATFTRQFVDAVSGTQAVIIDTRKTAPGLRALDKLAVKRGGAQNHRMNLNEMVLIKDNHIDYAGSLPEALRRVRESSNNLEIEVEARTVSDVRQAIGLGVKRILLDNMNISELREAVAINSGRAKLEASGNVTLENVREIARTGVDFISVGALTHSSKGFDASLELLA